MIDTLLHFYNNINIKGLAKLLGYTEVSICPACGKPHQEILNQWVCSNKKCGIRVMDVFDITKYTLGGTYGNSVKWLQNKFNLGAVDSDLFGKFVLAKRRVFDKFHAKSVENFTTAEHISRMSCMLKNSYKNEERFFQLFNKDEMESLLEVFVKGLCNKELKVNIPDSPYYSIIPLYSYPSFVGGIGLLDKNNELKVIDSNLFTRLSEFDVFDTTNSHIVNSFENKLSLHGRMNKSKFNTRLSVSVSTKGLNKVSAIAGKILVITAPLPEYFGDYNEMFRDENIKEIQEIDSQGNIRKSHRQFVPMLINFLSQATDFEIIGQTINVSCLDESQERDVLKSLKTNCDINKYNYIKLCMSNRLIFQKDGLNLYKNMEGYYIKGKTSDTFITNFKLDLLSQIQYEDSDIFYKCLLLMEDFNKIVYIPKQALENVSSLETILQMSAGSKKNPVIKEKGLYNRLVVSYFKNEIENLKCYNGVNKLGWNMATNVYYLPGYGLQTTGGVIEDVELNKTNNTLELFYNIPYTEEMASPRFEEEEDNIFNNILAAYIVRGFYGVDTLILAQDGLWRTLFGQSDILDINANNRQTSELKCVNSYPVTINIKNGVNPESLTGSAIVVCDEWNSLEINSENHGISWIKTLVANMPALPKPLASCNTQQIIYEQGRLINEKVFGVAIPNVFKTNKMDTILKPDTKYKIVTDEKFSQHILLDDSFNDALNECKIDFEKTEAGLLVKEVTKLMHLSVTKFGKNIFVNT